MAVDLLTQIQRDIDQRLAELRPRVAEAARLEEALAALGNGAPVPVSRPKPVRRAPSRATAPTSSGQAPVRRARISQAEAERRERQALAIITENPGTTAATLALLLDTQPGNLAPLLRRLQDEKLVEKHDKGFRRVGTNGAVAS